MDLHAIGLLYNDGNPLLGIVQLFLSIKGQIADILKEHWDYWISTRNVQVRDPMGYATPSYIKGNLFFLQTNSEQPYGKSARKTFQENVIQFVSVVSMF